MIVKRIVGKNRSDLEKKVFEELGKEAIILTTTRINDEQIEATVGVEENDLAVHQHHIAANQGLPPAENIVFEDADSDGEDFWNMATVPDSGVSRTLEADLFLNKFLLPNINESFSTLNPDEIEGGLESILYYLCNQGIAFGIAENICQSLALEHGNIDVSLENQEK